MRAVIYARYSSDRQRESSIDDQARNCTRHAEREGWTVKQLYKDEAITGATSARAGYQKMLADALLGHFDILLVDDLSRLSRDKLEMERVLRKLAFDGLRIVGVSDGYDSASKGHKIHSGVKGLMNEMFLDDLRDKTHRGMSGQAIKGYNCGGRTYGYRNVPIEDESRHDAYGRPAIIAVRYEIHPEQAEVVRQIYGWYAKGYAYIWIAKELNRLRAPAPRGNSWSGSGVKVILDNEMYEGKLVWNRKEWVKNPETGKRTYRERAQSEWIVTDNQALRIVLEDVVQAVRARQGRNREGYKNFKPSNAQRYLFSGLMACAECGGNFSLVANGRYGCASYKNRGECANSHTVSRHIIEERLLDGIKKQLISPENMAEFKKAAISIIEQRKATSGEQELSKRLKDTQKQHDNIMSAIRAGIVTKSTKDALEEAEREITDLQHMIKEGDQWKISGILPRAAERYQQAVQELEKEFTGHVSSAREVLKTLIGDRIMIHKREGYLEAEIPNHIPAVLARVAGNNVRLEWLRGRDFSESTFISLQPKLKDNSPLAYRQRGIKIVK